MSPNHVKTNFPKELIVELMKIDFIHNLFIEGLYELGLDDEGRHCLNLVEIIAQLMQVTEDNKDEWDSLYANFLDDAENLTVGSSEEEIMAWVEECYSRLSHVIKNSN